MFRKQIECHKNVSLCQNGEKERHTIQILTFEDKMNEISRSISVFEVAVTRSSVIRPVHVSNVKGIAQDFEIRSEMHAQRSKVDYFLWRAVGEANE